MNAFFTLLFCCLLVPSTYWFVLALASISPRLKSDISMREQNIKFAVVIPAHNEEGVIGASVLKLCGQDYPKNLYKVFVVADYCTDATAENSRKAGAIVFERNSGPRTGKGAALSWVFEKIFEDGWCDAVVIFDADTHVKTDFLQIMSASLIRGDQVIQGQHVIRNPDDGWFPALTWAMFLIDNRFQNLGRTNLGLSAKNMGDSICLRADVLQRIGWGEGLTEDYQLRQKLLLSGIKIVYEATALGFGEAALTWKQAQAQRIRWIRGAYEADRQFASDLLIKGLKTGDMALLDGALQAYLPSYSILTVVVIFFLLFYLIVNLWLDMVAPQYLVNAWVALLGVLFLYPFFGLALERAPLKAYLVILTGPFFIAWRIWLTLVGRFGRRNITWIRTAHKG